MDIERVSGTTFRVGGGSRLITGEQDLPAVEITNKSSMSCSGYYCNNVSDTTSTPITITQRLFAVDQSNQEFFKMAVGEGVRLVPRVDPETGEQMVEDGVPLYDELVVDNRDVPPSSIDIREKSQGLYGYSQEGQSDTGKNEIQVEVVLRREFREDFRV